MSRGALITLGIFIGSTIGGLIPTLFGADFLSYASLFGNGIGGILGVIVVFKLTA